MEWGVVRSCSGSLVIRLAKQDDIGLCPCSWLGGLSGGRSYSLKWEMQEEEQRSGLRLGRVCCEAAMGIGGDGTSGSGHCHYEELLGEARGVD